MIDIKTDNTCETKYPLLLVHGAGSIDSIHWGRIPDALTKHGARVFFGQQECWADIRTNAEGLVHRINEILALTQADKVNIIGHSKGGLEARMAASSLGMHDKIASITTIATPHHGSKTIELLTRLPDFMWRFIASYVNKQACAAGDRQPDFIKVCRELTTSYISEFNKNNPDQPGVLYQSYAGLLRLPFSTIALSFTKALVWLIEGQNDGLVSVSSALWGERRRVIRSNSLRGISHHDTVDMKKKPFILKSGLNVSDICDVYVQIARELRSEGF